MHPSRLTRMIVLAAFAAPALVSAKTVEKIRNQKVLTVEVMLAPGESESIPENYPSMVVYTTEGVADNTGRDGKEHKTDVKAGETLFQGAHSGSVKNAGTTTLHYARIEFLTRGLDETWDTKGLSPNYKMLLENRYGRAYDIRIPAQTFEPQHTHHDRVVVSLQGATLEHILPNGEKQPSTLKTGEIVWRLGATHIGHNLGQTNLWVIAVEPK
jgi:hypothetical protein